MEGKLLSPGTKGRLLQDENAEELFNDTVKEIEELPTNTENPRPEERLLQDENAEELFNGTVKGIEEHINCRKCKEQF